VKLGKRPGAPKTRLAHWPRLIRGGQRPQIPAQIRLTKIPDVPAGRSLAASMRPLLAR